MPVENLLPNFRHTLGAERIGRPRPPEWRFRLFPGLEQRLIGPLGSRRLIRSNAIKALKYCPCASGDDGHGLLYIFNRTVHSAAALLWLWPAAALLWPWEKLSLSGVRKPVS